MAGEQKGVRTQHADYIKHAPQWKRCRDAMAGQDAVHKAREAYLPKLKEQSEEDYRAYVLRATFYNASWRTVAGLVGMMFRKPPKQEMPTAIESDVENVNMQGETLDQFAKDVATEVLEVGRVGLLADYPTSPAQEGVELTQADVESLGLRPIIQTYPAESVINWDFRNVNNQTVLSLVVLQEEFSEPDPASEFNKKCETRYRVLDLEPVTNLYRVRVFRIGDKQQDELVSTVFPLMNGARIPFIPFVFVGPDGLEADCEEPPLIDLVDLNLSHYRVTADYEHGCHFTGLPTPWISGYNPSSGPDGETEKLYIGSQSAWVFPEATAKCGYLEFTGNGLTTLRENLDAKKQEMATLGARMLADTSVRQVETFGATAIKHVAENSILASIALAVSQGIQKSLDWFAAWKGVKGTKCVYDINRDFMPVQMDAQTLTALMAAWQQGGLSEPELFNLFKRGDLIDADKTLEDHQSEIDNAPPPAPPGSTQPGALGTMTPEEQIAHEKAKAAALPPKKVAA